jgi:hypothetical protein
MWSSASFIRAFAKMGCHVVIGTSIPLGYLSVGGPPEDSDGLVVNLFPIFYSDLAIKRWEDSKTKTRKMMEIVTIDRFHHNCIMDQPIKIASF